MVASLSFSASRSLSSPFLDGYLNLLLKRQSRRDNLLRPSVLVDADSRTPYNASGFEYCENYGFGERLDGAPELPDTFLVR